MKTVAAALALAGALCTLGQPALATPLGTLIARCAPHVAPRTALAVIAVESGGRWWAVNDNDAPTPALRSAPEALAYARRRIAAGGSIDLGITQLNSAHLAAMHLSVDEAFEPCTNIAMGMSVLEEAWSQSARRWGNTRYALLRAFEAYNGGPGAWSSRNPRLRARVEGYASAVWARAETLPLMTPPAAGASVAGPRIAAARAGRIARVRASASHGVHIVYQEGR